MTARTLTEPARKLFYWARIWMPRQLVEMLESLPHAALLGLGAAAAIVGLLSFLGLRLGPAASLLCTASGVFTAALAYRDFRWKRHCEAVTGEARAGADLEKQLAAQTLSLRSQVEILTAMREVSRLTVEEVNLHTLSQEVFQILTDLLGADEMTLYLYDRETRAFVPRLHRVGERVVGEKELLGEEGKELVARGRRMSPLFVREMEGETLYLTIPLIAEGEPLGALRIGFSAEDQTERIHEFEQKEYVLKDLAKHIALVVKAPILRARALTDGLTGLFTKRHFEEKLSHDVEEAERWGTPISLVLLDIDHFKSVNDTHGHPTGDLVLKRVAQAVKGSIRGSDSAYRFGGEEIAVLLPKTDLAHAHKAAERIRKRLERETMRTDTGKPLKVTASLGVAQHAAGAPSSAMVSQTDQALYRAKHGGRNRTAAAGDVPEGEKILSGAAETADSQERP